MTAVVPRSADFRALIRLAAPMMVVQVGLMMMGVVDTVFVGHVSATELAAASLGNLYFFSLTILGLGTLMAIDPVVSQAMGARDAGAVTRGFQRGLVVAVLISVPATLLCLPVGFVLQALRQPAAVVPRAAGFVLVSAPGMLPMLLFIMLRQTLQAMKRMRAIVITIVAANLVNAALNTIFVFGRFGVPPMGALGAALSSTLGRVFMLAMLLALSWRDLLPHFRPWLRESSEPGPVLRMLRLGLPIGFQYALEFGAFAVIALLAGWFGAEAMGGHQIALNLASLTFMAPLGMGSAAAVLVGHAVGSGDAAGARRIAGAALIFGGAFMAVSALVLRTIPGLFAGLYTTVPGVLAVATALIPIAGVFQIFDGLQVVSAGVLRGVGDTRGPLIVNVLGFWLIGMPVSLWCGFHQHLGVVGLWWGFVAALMAVALFLLLRVRNRLSGDLTRIQLDHVPAG